MASRSQSGRSTKLSYVPDWSSRARTCDMPVNSRLFYHLNYTPKKKRLKGA